MTTPTPPPPASRPQQPPKGIFYGWWILLAGHFGSALNGAFYFQGFGALFLPVASTFNASKTALSGAFSMARLEAGILGPLQGYLVDRFHARIVMTAGVIMMGGGFMILSVIPSLLWFYIVSVPLIAVGASFGFGPSVHAVVTNWFVKKRTFAFAIVLSGAATGGLFVPLLAHFIEAYGWRPTVFFSGLTIIILGLPVAMTMRHAPEPYGYHPDGLPPKPRTPGVASEGEDDGFTIKEALRSATFWIMGLCFAFRMMSSSGVPIHLSAYLQEDSGFSVGKASLYLGLIGSSGLFGRFAMAYLGDRIEKRYMLFVSLAAQAISMPILAITQNDLQAILFLILFATGHGGGAPLQLSVRGDYFGRRSYATISGFMATLLLLGTVTGPLLAGVLADNFSHGYDKAWYIYGALTGIAAVVLLFLKKPTPPHLKRAANT